MLRANQLRQVAGRSGARDIGNVEIDVILTYLLQLFAEKGVMEHVGFKGGTMLRKMIFGPRGRLSTDLDFTSPSEIGAEDLMLMMLDALERPYHGISFRFDRDKDWYLTDDGCAANPVCAHAENEKGVKIKLQVSMREQPVLPIRALPQIALDYFDLLEFAPVAVPCLAFEEVVAEKIRAANQRSKVRDLHDLSEISVRVLDREIIRSLAVLKLWNSDGPNLDYGRFRERITGAADYDVADLTTLLRRDQRPDLDQMIQRVVKGFRFLADLSDLERKLTADDARRRRADAEALRDTVKGRVGAR
jgi:predicted nucleotidyltransferase component of viral defense system